MLWVIHNAVKMVGVFLTAKTLSKKEKINGKLLLTRKINRCETGKISAQSIESRLLDDSFARFFRPPLAFNLAPLRLKNHS